MIHNADPSCVSPILLNHLCRLCFEYKLKPFILLLSVYAPLSLESKDRTGDSRIFQIILDFGLHLLNGEAVDIMLGKVNFRVVFLDAVIVLPLLFELFPVGANCI